jgi:hypothetical protein
MKSPVKNKTKTKPTSQTNRLSLAIGERSLRSDRPRPRQVAFRDLISRRPRRLALVHFESVPSNGRGRGGLLHGDLGAVDLHYNAGGRLLPRGLPWKEASEKKTKEASEKKTNVIFESWPTAKNATRRAGTRVSHAVSS